MKKLVSVLLAVLLVIGSVPLQAKADEEWLTVPGIVGGQIKFDSSTGTITNCNTAVTSANIPSEINGVAVSAIGDWAFYYCDSLTSVTIPDSVISIGERAFDWCTSLTGITIPDSVTSVGENAFCGCGRLWVFETSSLPTGDQFNRRNLPLYERARLALRLKPALAAKAKERQVEAGKQYGVGLPQKVPQNSAEAFKPESKPKPRDETRDQIATAAGVSHDTIAKVETIEAKATPEVKQQLRSGDITINKAYTDIRRAERENSMEKTT